jgi:hypothetical protein
LCPAENDVPGPAPDGPNWARSATTALDCQLAQVTRDGSCFRSTARCTRPKCRFCLVPGRLWCAAPTLLWAAGTYGFVLVIMSVRSVRATAACSSELTGNAHNRTVSLWRVSPSSRDSSSRRHTERSVMVPPFGEVEGRVCAGGATPTVLRPAHQRMVLSGTRGPLLRGGFKLGLLGAD